MAIWDNLNDDETKAIEELRARFKNVLSSEKYNDKLLFYRFLKARNFDIDKAEEFLRKNIAWRKAFQVDNILEWFQPSEAYEKYVHSNFLGCDKEGNLVVYFPSGKMDAQEIAKSIKRNDLETHFAWFAETSIRRINKENERTGRKAYQGVHIFDLDCITFAKITYRATADQLLQMTNMLQDNYPESLKYAFVINAPAYITIVFSVLKRIMSNETLQKIRIFGRNGWKECLRKEIDADVLPAFLGGNRTDPDGDPMCKTFIRFGGKIPSQYFLSPEERTFKNKSKVKKINVSPNSSVKLPAEVEDVGSVIQCEFEVKSKDIGFGLFFQKSENELEDVLPIQRFMTVDGTHTVSYKSQSKGIYIIIFDNSHSWYNSKDVYYCLTVK